MALSLQNPDLTPAASDIVIRRVRLPRLHRHARPGPRGGHAIHLVAEPTDVADGHALVVGAVGDDDGGADVCVVEADFAVALEAHQEVGRRVRVADRVLPRALRQAAGVDAFALALGVLGGVEGCRGVGEGWVGWGRCGG